MKNEFVKTKNVKSFLNALSALSQRGAKEACLMVVDGKPGLGKTHAFGRAGGDHIAGQQRHACRQLGIAPHEAVFIDDNFHGIHCAKAAGCIAVGFVAPSDDRKGHAETLRAEGGDHVVHGMAEFHGLLKTLTSEKARTSQEIENGASSIIPVGAVAHMFGGSEKESFEIGTGEYNKKLDSKIANIQSQCNL